MAEIGSAAGEATGRNARQRWLDRTPFGVVLRRGNQQ